MMNITRMRMFWFVLSLMVSACGGGARTLEGNGTLEDEERAVAAFTRVRIENSLRATVATGPSRVFLHMDKNLLSQVRTRVEGETLVVGATSAVDLKMSLGARIEISAPALAAVTSAESAEVTATVETAAPELVCLDSGQMTATLISAASLHAEVGGACRLSVQGDVGTQTVVATDSGLLEASGSAQSADVRASDSARVLLQVTEAVTINASDSSEVRISGQPPQRDVVTGGSAQVLFP